MQTDPLRTMSEHKLPFAPLTPGEANPFDPGPEPGPFNAHDAVGLVAAAILAWLTLAMWLHWPPFA